MRISKQLINGFIKSEFELFKKQFDETPVPKIQDERSLAIAWLCYYFKDSISSEISCDLKNFVDFVGSRESYSTNGWYRISSLQAAVFILSSEIYYANRLIQHLDCGQSWARGFILESVSIICPLLSFNNQYLKIATENNIKYSHALDEENIVLYLSTTGTDEDKINWIENQHRICEKDYHRKFLNGLQINDRPYQNSFFVRAFNKIKSYVIFKLLCQPILDKSELSLFDEIDYLQVVSLEKNHPLNDIYFDLSYLKGNI